MARRRDTPQRYPARAMRLIRRQVDGRGGRLRRYSETVMPTGIVGLST
jgi:hypothetical protein